MSFTATYLEKITASNSTGGNYYGSSVALSADGNTMAAAVSYVSGSSNQANGAVRILTKSAGAWSQSASIITPDSSSDDYFDYSLSLSSDGTILVVGMMSADSTYADEGKVYVYRLSGGSWSLSQTISNQSAGVDDNFGASVAVSGNGQVIVVGAPRGDKSGVYTNSGAVFTYVYDGSTFVYAQKLYGSDSSTDDVFGASVAVSYDGNYIAVGSVGEYTSTNPQGTVYVFYRASTLWAQQQKITAAQAAAGNYFGHSVSMSADGFTLAIGSSSADDSNTADLSSVTVFKRTGSTWAVEGNLLKSSSSSTAEYFGHSVSVSFDGDTVLAGVWEGDTVSSTESGSAYVFRRSSGSWSQVQRIVSSDTDLAPYFGYAVAVAPQTGNMVVTAPYSSAYSSNAGYIYSYSIDLTDADTYFPLVLPDKTITTVSKTMTSIVVSWNKAIDNINSQSALQYEVRYSTSNNISTLANFESNGTIAMAYTADVSSYNITGLYPGRGYYVNVAVKDASGNKTLYTSHITTAQADSLAPVPGNSGTIVASNAGLTSIDLSWSKATDNYSAAGDITYSVYYSTSNNISTVSEMNSNGIRFLNASADIASCTVTGLTPGTTYYFNIMVKDEFSLPAAYVAVSRATQADTTAPTVGILSVSAVTLTSVSLSWTAATDNYSTSLNTYYAVYYSTSDNISTIADAEANGILARDYQNSPRSHSITGLTPNTQYYFNVIAKDQYDNKAAYTKISYSTSADITGPVPGNSGILSTVAASETQIDISWTAAVDNYSNSSNVLYAVYVSTTNNISTVANAEANGTKIMDYAANTTSYSATGLNFNTQYYFNVVVKDEYNNKSIYSSSSETTYGDSSAPTAGGSGVLSVSVLSERTVSLSWVAASDNLASSSSLEYAVYYSTSNNISTVSDAEANGTKSMDYTANTISHIVGSLTEETTYYFNVIVKDTAGNKTAYSAASATTNADTTNPAVGTPNTISVTNLADVSLTLNWTKATDNYDNQSALVYKIYRASSNVLTSVNQTESNGTLIGTGININSFNVTGLTPSTSYYFNVIVIDSSNNKSLYSSINSTTLTDAQAPTPGNSGAISLSGVTVSSINVSWTVASDNITSAQNLQYAVYRSSSNNISTVVDAEANGVQVMPYSSNVNSCTSSGLIAATTYYFNVIVKDATGNKAAYNSTNTITQADTSPPVPGSSGAISVSYITKSSMVLTWTKAVDNYTAQSNLRYEVRRSTSNNIGTVSTFKNGTIVKAFTNDISTTSVDGLMPNTTYYFNVMVMDTFGNRAVYSMANADTQADASGPTPGNSGTISFSGTTLQETVVSWSRASDEGTYFEDLEYALYYSTSANISSVGGMETNGTLIMDYEVDTVSFPMTDLTPGTTYYFNVIVKDELGNKSAYTMSNVTTVADTTAPTPGGLGSVLSNSVTTNSAVISWNKAEDNITAQEDIRYAVYRSLSNNITTVANMESNGTMIMSYTADVAQMNVTGLTSSFTYYFNVIAKDAAGNKSAYVPAKVSTVVDTSVPSPGNSGVLGASLVTPSSVTISWTKGTDNVTDAGFLMYGVYYSTSNNISTVADIEANGTLAKQFARDIAVQTVTNLDSDQNYYFNVMIRDSAGNKSCYSTVYARTLEDIDPPVPGGSGFITASNIQLTSVLLSWNRATDNASVPPNLQYQVRMSTSDNISTVALAEANGTVVGAYSSLNYATISNLNSGDTYYFNVIVKDAKGNKSIYATKQQKTKNDVVEVPSAPVAINQPVVVESSTDKIKTLPQVSTHPTLSKPRNWAKVHIIYKSTTSAKRVVVSITDFSQMLGTFKAKNAEIFAVHKVIVEDANNNFVTVPASFIMNADNWNIDVD